MCGASSTRVSIEVRSGNDFAGPIPLALPTGPGALSLCGTGPRACVGCVGVRAVPPPLRHLGVSDFSLVSVRPGRKGVWLFKSFHRLPVRLNISKICLLVICFSRELTQAICTCCFLKRSCLLFDSMCSLLNFGLVQGKYFLLGCL